MSDLVLVSRDDLEDLIEDAWAVHSGQVTPDIVTHLEPDDLLVTLAVEAGVFIPGPMKPGTVPPVPPKYRFANAADRFVCAATYRTKKDPRLRCEADAKVVYTTMEQASHAARCISGREPMGAYLGQCGHYHVSRRKK